MSYRDEREALRAEKRRLEEELDDARERLDELEHDDGQNVAGAFAERVRKMRVRLVVIGGVFVALVVSGVLLRVRPVSPVFVVVLGVVLIGSIAYVRYVFLRCPRCEHALGNARAKSCSKCGARLSPRRD